MKPKSKGVLGKSRKDQTVHWLGLSTESRHDTYKSRGKLPESTRCPRCGAVFHKGRWTWTPASAQAHEEVCPACHRIEDKYPAGMVHLSGPFLDAHREELLRVVRHQEQEAKREHPLSRIIGIEESGEGTVVTTTDTHLPRRIGEALRNAYHGELTFHYAEDPRLLRMNWKR